MPSLPSARGIWNLANLKSDAKWSNLGRGFRLPDVFINCDACELTPRRSTPRTTAGSSAISVVRSVTSRRHAILPRTCSCASAGASFPTAKRGALRGWLFQIARNLALDHHRSGQRRPPHEALTDIAARPASQDTSAEVNDALASLADLDRDVFVMREVAGLGYEEIAAACGLTPDAVRSRIHRTRLQLRERLSGQIAAVRSAPMRQSCRRVDGTLLRQNTHER
jgi:Sigma-70, region 4